MIPIVINGRIRHKAEVYAYVERIAKELNIHRFRTKPIEINIVRHCDGSYGDTWGDKDEGVEINIARNRYDQKIAYSDMLKTLAHEMVHAKQYLRDELNGYKDTWKGKPCHRLMKKKWEDQPWEVEANRLEDKLYRKCWKGK